MELPPLSLYVHIPWCVRKCPYCDFNSHEAGDNIPEDTYVAALEQDLAADLPLAQGRAIGSVFFGGGTPSLFSGRAIGRILEAVQQRLGLATDAEITLEANPGTSEQQRFHDYRVAGVNRLSIGIQSFGDAQLRLLGRIHSAGDALAAVAMARRAGFDNINLDLMHGLPEQSPDDAARDLIQAIELAPEHLSWYQLTIEPNTAFYRQPPTLPPDDTLAAIQEQGLALLHAGGYRQYEVSAYARPGRQARHNLNYWTFGDYLGIGAGAHGKITRPELGEILRLWKTRLPRHYLDPQRLAVNTPGHDNRFGAGGELIEPAARPLEFLLNALRLNEGVPAATYTQRTGLPLSTLEPQWEQLQARELVSTNPKILCATSQGHRFLNTLLESFL